MQERVDTGIDNETTGQRVEGVSRSCTKACGQPRRKPRTGRRSRREGTRRKWGGEFTTRRALLKRPSYKMRAKVSKGSPSDLCTCRRDHKDGEGIQGKAGA